MQEATAVTTIAVATGATPAALDVRPIVAIAREDFVPAQNRLIALFTTKEAEQASLAAELDENLAIAKRNKWRHSGIQRALLNARRLQLYYESARIAVEQGYMLMPNLDADVYAVRVADRQVAGVPAATESRYSNPDFNLVSADKGLGAGEGEYVSDEPQVYRSTRKRTGSDGKEETIHRAEPVDLQSPEAPLVLARPVLLEAAQRAMALSLFDEIGIVGANRQSRRADPMLVGRLVHPVTRGRMLTFFLAWWMDPASV